MLIFIIKNNNIYISIQIKISIFFFVKISIKQTKKAFLLTEKNTNIKFPTKNINNPTAQTT